MNDVKSHKPKMIPLQVSWRVDLCTPFLRLVDDNSNTKGTAVVEFVAYTKVGIINYHSRTPNDGRSVQIVSLDDTSFAPTEGPFTSANRLIRIEFSGVVHVEDCLAITERDVIGRDAYDWSALPVQGKEDDGFYDFVNRSDLHWKSTGICPDPYVYYIESNHPDYKREYIIEGHDEYIVVKCNGHKVIYGQCLNWD